MLSTIFTPDTASGKLTVERDFNAGLARVWDAWTTEEQLTQWWAPKPFKAITKSLHFREGGQWHYHMLGPQGEKFWCMVNFSGIDPLKHFSSSAFFCDEAGTRNTDIPGMDWLVSFRENGQHTRVTVNITYASTADMETIMAMGFKEGFTAAHENLDALLAV